MQKQRLSGKKPSAKAFWGAFVLTLAGYAAAIAVNLLVPQISDGVVIKEYTFGSVTLNINSTYRLVLAALIAAYAVIGLFSLRDERKQAHFVSRAQFRFAVGLALALWDVTGTKLQVLPQPFFPGPAGILEAFLVEGDYIWTNTLYSLRLFAAGFTVGVIFGVVTGVLIG
ncbi:MAG: ABC transporter permease, partial [Oscillospiraceae bacterium]|nr:ABC transporter permease [Oscillospiraceae bacterium]